MRDFKKNRNLSSSNPNAPINMNVPQINYTAVSGNQVGSGGSIPLASNSGSSGGPNSNMMGPSSNMMGPSSNKMMNQIYVMEGVKPVANYVK